MRKQFPGTTTANGIEDAVEDLAAAVFGRSTTAFAGRHERYQRFPFSIGEVGIVSGSRRSQPARVNNRTFSNSLLSDVRSLYIHVERVNRLASGHEEAVAARAAEA